MCELLHMATNLAIDDQLLNEAGRVGGQRTKKSTVTQALEERPAAEAGADPRLVREGRLRSEVRLQAPTPTGMNIIIDTSVWSLALRRQRTSPSAETRELAELVREGRAAMLGPVRQELLSGVRSDQQFQRLRDHLRVFPDAPLEAEDYEEAASFFNKCRAKGIQGTNTDYLICAVAGQRGFGILTTDTAFSHFARVLPIDLHTPRASVTGSPEVAS